MASTPPIELPPAYYWNPVTGRFHRRDNNRFVSFREILALGNVLEDMKFGQMEELAQAYLSGVLTETQWYAAMAQAVRTAHVHYAALGAGGFEMLTATQYAVIAPRIADDLDRLTRFAKKLPSMAWGAIQHRIRMYLGNARVNFYKVASLPRIPKGSQVVEKRLLTPGDNCEWCKEQAALGWQRYGTLAAPGEVFEDTDKEACYTSCRCQMVRRVVTDSEALQLIGVGDDTNIATV